MFDFIPKSMIFVQLLFRITNTWLCLSIDEF